MKAEQKSVRTERSRGAPARPSHERPSTSLGTNEARCLALRLGLRQVEGLRIADAARVVAGHPYARVEDLRTRAQVPVHSIERLAAADAFRSIGLDRRAALWDAKALKNAPDLPLFAAADARDEGAEGVIAELPAMPLAEHVVNDYQTMRLSLKAHPMTFLRDHYAARGFVTAQQLGSIRDGRRLSIAGLVLIRQRPGSAKGVVFITIEDETGVANLVIWPDVFERQRKIVMGARLMAVQGIVQKDEQQPDRRGQSGPAHQVIHVVARQLQDDSAMLRHLSEDMLPSTLSQADAPGSWRPPAGRHPRDAEIIPKSRDFH